MCYCIGPEEPCQCISEIFHCFDAPNRAKSIRGRAAAPAYIRQNAYGMNGNLSYYNKKFSFLCNIFDNLRQNCAMKREYHLTRL